MLEGVLAVDASIRPRSVIAEKLRGHLGVAVGAVASIRPRSVIAEKEPRGGEQRAGAGASIRPRSVIAEKRLQRPRGVPQQVASIRPRSVIAEKGRPDGATGRSGSSFNSAAISDRGEARTRRAQNSLHTGLQFGRDQ